MSPLPEYALLLDAVAPLDRARAAYDSWDSGAWGRTLHVAYWHRLSPILYCHLEAAGDAPEPVVCALERAYLANSARSMFIAAALRRALDALQAADVPALLLKGAALVETVYPDPAQREMLDLDILVPADQLAVANTALAALGYRPEPEHEASEEASVRLQQPPNHHDQALVDDDQLVAVELHRHLTTPEEGRRFEIGEIWQRARPSPVGGHLLPSPEDLLIHVCLHFTRNRIGGTSWRRNTGGALGQVCDIARIIDGETVDWEVLSGAARRGRLDARVFLALFAARELGVPIPHRALAGLRPAGFDEELGRRLVALRVLRADDHMPVRTMRWMFAPSREALTRGWNADPTATLSLARAYLRRARAHAPLAQSVLRQPWAFIQDQRLNGQIEALEDRA